MARDVLMCACAQALTAKLADLERGISKMCGPRDGQGSSSANGNDSDCNSDSTEVAHLRSTLAAVRALAYQAHGALEVGK